MGKNIFYFIKKFVQRLKRKGRSSISDLVYRKIKYRFKDDLLLSQALTHRSYLKYASNRLNSNERLEFLGDAVLDLVVSSELYKIFSEKNEGDLTKIKSLLVNSEALASRARKIDLGELIFLGDGEDKAGGRDRESIVADTIEALIGSIYIDGGIKEAEKFIKTYIIFDIEKFNKEPVPKNYKSLLLEHIQEKTQTVPAYKVFDEKGPDHNKIFTVNVSVEGEILGTGKGKSKKKAEQKAAFQAAKKIGLINDSKRSS